MAEAVGSRPPFAVEDLQCRLGGRTSAPTPRVSVSSPALADLALHGLAGEVVRAIDPHTEADPAAILSNLLVLFGSALGRTPHTLVGDTRHGVNLNVVQVGESSKGRKGTAMATPRRLIGTVDREWEARRIVTGLSSGEGLIWAVRDPIEKTEPIREKKTVVGYQTVREDPGVQDKRLLVIEEEFASVLQRARRDGNTLSAVLRQAWDGHDLRVLTKTSPASSTAPHVSVVGHITRDELVRNLDSTEAANGFANRFLWVWVKRSKCLPEGGRVPEDQIAALSIRLGRALQFGRRVGEIRRDDQAKALWKEVYAELSEGRPGLLGAITARAEAQVLRLSSLYALLAESAMISPDHLGAALAFWHYCERSAQFVFGDAVGDPVADRILRTLRTNGPMTQDAVVNLFGRNLPATRIMAALEPLVDACLVTSSVRSPEGGRGRPATVWVAT
ncbi:MAG: YfjI family protein [Chloroflexota bacterium]|nr:YfjI family protein [Chloroflexota bacterium]